jgi:hypothetical protein
MVKIPGIQEELRFEDLYPGCSHPSEVYLLDPLLSEDLLQRALRAAVAWREWASRGFPQIEECEDIPFLGLLGPSLLRDPSLDDKDRFIVMETLIGHELEDNTGFGISDGMRNVGDQACCHMFTPPFLKNLPPR